MIDQPRPRSVRRADVLAMLSAPVADAWVATTDGARPHLVPLTLAWHDERIVLATDSSSPTARNLVTSGVARVALGATRDVVMIEATLDVVLPATSDEAAVAAEAYAAQSDWDPREAGPAYVFLLLRPERIQAWREIDELRDRTLMRDGLWVD